MARPFFFFFFFSSFYFFIIALLAVVECSSHHRHLHQNNHQSRGVGLTKLFVFGDSYAANGNNKRINVTAWSVPYGVTFPGKPTGRWSDGRVFSDYLASYLKIKSPIPYRWRNTGTDHLKYGMNFAYGGTGVFDTQIVEPNMTTQIDFLEKLIKDGVYTKQDISSSIAYLSLVGNDFSTYISRNGSIEGLSAFITTVVNQLALDLNRVGKLGVGKVTVNALPPLGCLPGYTAATSYKNCNETLNTAVNFYNQLLQGAVAKLNNATRGSTFVIIDLYSAFLSAFQSQGKNPGSLKFDPPFKPCCMGISSQYFCGSVDEHSVKKYTTCQDPKSAFFWDSSHPTQEGWVAVYSALRRSLNQLFY